jgi:hypothetical protein
MLMEMLVTLPEAFFKRKETTYKHHLVFSGLIALTKESASKKELPMEAGQVSVTMSKEQCLLRSQPT